MQNLSKKFFKRTKIVSTFGPAITSDILSLKDLEDPSKKEVVTEVYDRVQKLKDLYFSIQFLLVSAVYQLTLSRFCHHQELNEARNQLLQALNSLLLQNQYMAD